MFDGRPLRDYLATRDVGAVLRFLRARGWSRAALAAATGLSETRVRQVAQGRQQIQSYDVLERIAEGLRIPRGLMGLGRYDEGSDAPYAAGPASPALDWLVNPAHDPLPATPAGAMLAAGAVTEASTMHRRDMLLLVGAAATGPAHEWLLATLSPTGASASTAQVPASVVDHLDEITGQLRRMDDQLGGGRLLSLVRRQARFVLGLLEQHRYGHATGLRLHASLAELLRLAGWLAFDSGHHAQAQRFWIAALHAARTAGDRALGANILGFMSCQAKDLGHRREAITFAQTALAGYAGGAARVSAILHLRAAEAHAVAGERGECRQHIDDAFDALDGPAPDGGEPGWCYWLDVAHAHGQAGYAYLRLSDLARARTHLEEATRLQGPSCAREAALRHTLLALTYARQAQPDLDEAVALGGRALDALAGDIDSSRCVGHLTQLSATLAVHQASVAVREFRGRVSELASAAKANSPR